MVKQGYLAICKALAAALLTGTVVGCDVNVIRDATAVQLETSLITLISQLAGHVIYNFLGLPSALPM